VAWEIFLFYFFSYLLGSIPFALVVSLPQGVDPRKAGSKNPGATNVARLLGKKWGLITFLGDAGKGITALLIASYFLKDTQLPKELILAGVGFFAVLGHLFSVFLKFKGGKGVATALGVLLALNVWVGVGALVTWLFMAVAFRYSSLAALAASIAAPIYAYLFYAPREWVFASGIMSLMLVWRHKSNIQNLLAGNETKLGGKKKAG